MGRRADARRMHLSIPIVDKAVNAAGHLFRDDHLKTERAKSGFRLRQDFVRQVRNGIAAEWWRDANNPDFDGAVAMCRFIVEEFETIDADVACKLAAFTDRLETGEPLESKQLLNDVIEFVANQNRTLIERGMHRARSQARKWIDRVKARIRLPRGEQSQPELPADLGSD